MTKLNFRYYTHDQKLKCVPSPLSYRKLSRFLRAHLSPWSASTLWTSPKGRSQYILPPGADTSRYATDLMNI